MKLSSCALCLLLAAAASAYTGQNNLNNVPVCGSFYGFTRTFANALEFNKEYINSRKLWKFISSGPCPPVSECNVYNPVCGVSVTGKTQSFVNSCLMQAHQQISGTAWQIKSWGICPDISVDPASTATGSYNTASGNRQNPSPSLSSTSWQAILQYIAALSHNKNTNGLAPVNSYQSSSSALWVSAPQSTPVSKYQQPSSSNAAPSSNYQQYTQTSPIPTNNNQNAPSAPIKSYHQTWLSSSAPANSYQSATSANSAKPGPAAAQPQYLAPEISYAQAGRSLGIPSAYTTSQSQSSSQTSQAGSSYPASAVPNGVSYSAPPVPGGALNSVPDATSYSAHASPTDCSYSSPGSPALDSYSASVSPTGASYSAPAPSADSSYLAPASSADSSYSAAATPTDASYSALTSSTGASYSVAALPAGASYSVPASPADSSYSAPASPARASYSSPAGASYSAPDASSYSAPASPTDCSYSSPGSPALVSYSASLSPTGASYSAPVPSADSLYSAPASPASASYSTPAPASPTGASYSAPAGASYSAPAGASYSAPELPGDASAPGQITIPSNLFGQLVQLYLSATSAGKLPAPGASYVQTYPKPSAPVKRSSPFNTTDSGVQQSQIPKITIDTNSIPQTVAPISTPTIPSAQLAQCISAIAYGNQYGHRYPYGWGYPIYNIPIFKPCTSTTSTTPAPITATTTATTTPAPITATTTATTTPAPTPAPTTTTSAPCISTTTAPQPAQTIYNGMFYQAKFNYEPKENFINFGKFNFLPAHLGGLPNIPVIPRCNLR